MDKAVEFEGKKYISAKKAAEITGYTSDYVGQLCRGNKLNAKLVGRSWYVLEKEILEYKKNNSISHFRNLRTRKIKKTLANKFQNDKKSVIFVKKNTKNNSEKLDNDASKILVKNPEKNSEKKNISSIRDLNSIKTLYYNSDKNLFPVLEKKVNFERLKYYAFETLNRSLKRPKEASFFEKMAIGVSIASFCILLLSTVFFGRDTVVDLAKTSFGSNLKQELALVYGPLFDQFKNNSKEVSGLNQNIDQNPDKNNFEDKQLASSIFSGGHTQNVFNWMKNISYQIIRPWFLNDQIIIVNNNINNNIANDNSKNSSNKNFVQPRTLIVSGSDRDYVDKKITELKETFLFSFLNSVSIPNVTRTYISRQNDVIVDRIQSSSSGGGGGISLSDLSATGPISYNSGTGAFAFDFSTNNSWTGLNQFKNSSSTILSAYSSYFGGTATSSFNSAGVLTLAGQTGCLQADGSGVVSGTGVNCGSGSGSGGGSWSTTTSQVSGQFINYSNNVTDIVAIGAVSTTTAEFWFDPNTRTFLLNSASSTIIGNSTTTGTLGAGAFYVNNDYITDFTGSGLSVSGGALTATGLQTYDAWTHPAVGISATTSQLTVAGLLSTASSTISSDLFLSSLTQGYSYIGSNGIVKTVSTSTLAGQVFPFTSNTNYNSTSTTLGFLNGFFSTASSTISSNFFLPSLSQGVLYNGSNGLTQTTATGSVTCTGLSSCGSTSFVIGSALTVTSSYDAWTHPSAGISATSTAIFGIGTTTPVLTGLTVSSSTILTDGEGIAGWVTRNAGGNLYFATTTVAGTATTSISALSIIGSSGKISIASSTPWGLLSVNANALAAGTPQFVVGSSTATNFVVANNGYVGIGTANPTTLLTVGNGSGSATMTLNSAAAGSGTPSIDIARVGTNLWSIYPDASNRLLVQGSSGLTSSIFRVASGEAADVPSIELARGSTLKWTLYSDINDTFIIATSTFDVFNIFSNRNVAIGTSTAGIKGLTIASSTILTDGEGIAGWVTRNAGGNLYFATTTVAGTATTSVSALTIDGTSGTTTVYALNVSASGVNATSTIEGNLHVKNFLKVGVGSVYLSDAGIVTTSGSSFDISNSAGSLSVSTTGFGTTTVTGFNINGQATSTSNVGFNITTGCYAIAGTCVGGGSGSGLTSYDAWTHPSAGISATSTAIFGIGTTTPTLTGLTVSSSTILTDGAGIAGWVTRNAGGNLYFATTTVAGTATTSISALEISGSGFGTTTVRGLNIAGQATSTSNVGFNITAGCYAVSGTCLRSATGNELSSYDAWTHPSAGISATSTKIFGIGTTTPTLNGLTVASSTILTDGAGTANWVTRNAGGNLYFSTTTVAGTATTSISALEISGSGFGTTTLRGLNIIGQATSTSNIGYNITAGCFAISGTCVGGGSGSGASTTLLADTNSFTGLNRFTYSSSTIYSSFETASTTNLVINGESFNDLTGSGLSISSGALTNAGLLSLTHTSGSAQTGAITFATSTTAISNDWGITNSAGTFTFNFPSASASVRGLLTSTDWTTFNSKLGSYDAWTHPASGISATTSQITVAGLLSTASSTISSDLRLSSLSQGYPYVGSGGLVQTVSTSTLAGQVFPFTSNTNYNATGTTLGFLNGFFSTASSTQSGNLFLPSLAQGVLYNGSNGLTQTTGTSSVTCTGLASCGSTSFVLGSALTVTSSYDAWTHPSAGISATSTKIFGIGTTTPTLNGLTVSSSTILTDGAGTANWVTRNAGGNLYFATTTVAGTATTSISALEIAGDGFGTTTVRGLNISAQATSTSNVGFNITTGCYAVSTSCLRSATGNELSSYDAFTHPAAGQSATTSLMLLFGQASSTQLSANQAWFGGTGTTTITNTGWIGQGTSTPWAQLSVNSEAGNVAFVIGSSTKTDFIVDKNGHVGVGTTTPWAQFSVNPNALGSSVPEFVIGSSTATHFIVTGSGNVGIGTSSPYAKLSVVGEIVGAYFTGTTTATSTFAGPILVRTIASDLSSASGLILGSTSTPQIIGLDTINNRVQIGLGTGTAEPKLFVLDTKNTSGDPTGVNGSMYYNSNTNLIRCYVNGSWVSCGAAATTTAIEINDCTPKITNTDFAPGGSWWQPLDMTNDFIGAGAWTFQEATSSEVTCFVKLPRNLANTPAITLNTAFVSTTTNQANVALDVYVSYIDPSSASLDRTAANLTDILAGSTTAAHLLVPSATAWTSVSTSTSVTPIGLSSDVLIIRYRRYAADADDANTGDLYLWKQWLEVTLNAN